MAIPAGAVAAAAAAAAAAAVAAATGVPGAALSSVYDVSVCFLFCPDFKKKYILFT